MWSEVGAAVPGKRNCKTLLFCSIYTLLLSRKLLRLRSEPSLPEHVELRPESTKLALGPIDMFNLRNMAHSQLAKSASRTDREVKVRMGLCLPLRWNGWVSEERSVSPNPKRGECDYKILTEIYCHLVAEHSIFRPSVHTLVKSL